ncbi:MAG: TIGR00730 family Rossman fold protein [Candidatus Omnitrophica bacterium]|nr:TIGR00730 family Rossman fold protein [Candidatus Omnitrophota bacterium]
MVTTVVRLRDEKVDRGDLKILNTAVKELRYSFKVFTPYRLIRKVAIFGSARTPKTTPAYKQAKEFAREITRRGWMVITGGSTGIMNAGNEGGGRDKSFGMNIRLPFEQEANPVIARDPKLINFKYFFTRKLMFLKESDATVLFPGGFGTHDEGFETLTLVQTGKTEPRPIVFVDPPGNDYWDTFRRFVEKGLLKEKMIDPEDLDLMTFTHDIQEAIQEVVGFYRNYHSLRFVGHKLVVRMQHSLEKGQLNRLNKNFQRIIQRGKIEAVRGPLQEEENEPETHKLERIVFEFNRKDFSLLRKMIDVINENE